MPGDKSPEKPTHHLALHYGKGIQRISHCPGSMFSEKKPLELLLDVTNRHSLPTCIYML